MALEDKFDDIKKLIDTGKEKGYLTYDQVNDLIPHDVHSPEDLDDLLTTIGTQGIDVLEGPKLPSAALDRQGAPEVLNSVSLCQLAHPLDPNSHLSGIYHTHPA